jgi:hypothetical protein
MRFILDFNISQLKIQTFLMILKKGQTMKKQLNSVMENLRDQKSPKKKLINFALNYCITIHIIQ